MRTLAVATLVLALALAGCSDKGGKSGPDSGEFDELGLKATETTGVIRGVIVDEAVRPISQVVVAITGVAAATTSTDENGLFGFQGLQPGTYFITAGKPGFSPTQQSVDVEAGVADPPILKILLASDPSSVPFAATYVFDGFIDCSVSFFLAGLAACSTADTGLDNFDVQYIPDSVPQFAQSEMHWRTTQVVSPNLGVVWSRSVPGQTLLDNWEQDQGTSPLLLKADRARIEEVGLGADLQCADIDDGQDGPDGCLYLRVFNAPIDGTNPTCVPRPVLGGCTTGIGATVKQAFTIISNIFYGAAPEEGWLYAVDGPWTYDGP